MGDNDKMNLRDGAKKRSTDATLRVDDEEDTLYEDGLELEDESKPFTGKDGRDDTV